MPQFVAIERSSASRRRIRVENPRFFSLCVTILVHIAGLLLIVCGQFPHGTDQSLQRDVTIITTFDASTQAAPAKQKPVPAAAIFPQIGNKKPARVQELRHLSPDAATTPAASANANFDQAAPEGIAESHEPRDAAQDYREVLFARLAEHRNYPEAARLRDYQGDGTLSFRIDRRGNLLAAAMERSTGRAVLDRAALKQVRRSAPFPEIPPELPDELVVAVPLQFLILPPARQMAAR